MTRTVTMALAGLLALAPGLAAADTAEGKAVYGKKCAACHAATGEGNAKLGKMLGVTFRHLGAKEVQARTDGDIKKVVTAGEGKMKGVTGLSVAQVGDVLAFVRTLKQ